MSNESIIDFEKLKTAPQTGPLSEEAQDQIRRQADRELAEEEAARNGQKETAEPKKDDAPKEPDAQPDPEKEAREAEAKKAAEEKAAAAQAEAQKKTDEAILAKKEEDLTPEEKTRKGELLKVEEEAFTEKVKQFAVAEKIPEDQARKQLESERAVLKKYEADPKKMARTIVHQQRMYSQLETKAKQEQEQKALALAEGEIQVKGKRYAIDSEEGKAIMVEAYREKLGEKSAGMDDDKVYEAAKAEWKQMVKNHYEATKAKVAEAAKSKREEMIKALPESAKPYQAAVEEVLKNTPDAHIVHEGFDIEDLVVVARGQFYTPEKIKELETAAFERGKENSRILGEKTASGAGTGGSNTKTDKPDSPDEEVAMLTPEQKTRALSMFDGISVWDENRKMKEYVAHLKDTGEWKPKKK